MAPKTNSLLFQVFTGGPFLPHYCACHLSRGISNRSSAHLLWVQHRLEYWKLEKWWKKLIFDKAFQQSRIENILTFWFLKVKWKGIHTFILQEYPRAWHLKQTVTVIFHITAKLLWWHLWICCANICTNKSLEWSLVEMHFAHYCRFMPLKKFK